MKVSKGELKAQRVYHYFTWDEMEEKNITPGATIFIRKL